MTTYVYRIYDAANEGSLLYVGMTTNVTTRLSDHRAKVWGDQIGKVVVTSYATRELAAVAEKDAIRRERPRYNKIRYQHESGLCENCGESLRADLWARSLNDGSNLGFSMRLLLSFVQHSDLPVTPAQLVTLTGLPRTTVDVYLGRLRMSGYVSRVERGHYMARMRNVSEWIAEGRRGCCLTCEFVAVQPNCSKDGFWIFPTAEQNEALDLFIRAQRSLEVNDLAKVAGILSKQADDVSRIDFETDLKDDLEALKIFSGFRHFVSNDSKANGVKYSEEDFWPFCGLYCYSALQDVS
jgi:predicted GIY-YIG superfamily endonuclease